MSSADRALALFWFRRDLRLEDNVGLVHALKSDLQVMPIFIFDENILSDLADPRDARITFIYRQLESLKKKLESQFQSTLSVYHGTPRHVIQRLIEVGDVRVVYANEDYEPYAIDRDQKIADLLKQRKIEFRLFKDQVIFAKDEVIKADGNPYTVFTPYSKKWLEQLDDRNLDSVDINALSEGFLKSDPKPLPGISEVGFIENTGIDFPEKEVSDQLIRSYHELRNFPAEEGTSRLGVHLRFGTISIRSLVRQARRSEGTFLSELIWREFFMQILWHFPHVVERSFRPQFDEIRWRNNEMEFVRWCRGMTGFPLVDAGMRELNQTGFMHNRVRMVVASFLTKDLLIDWRWGEAYFAQKLLDYELASNNGNWQWAAGTGCDAAPYFRIFNPESQLQKFDPESTYVRKWIPELDTPEYPVPMIDHKEARKRALEVYGDAVKVKSEP